MAFLATARLLPLGAEAASVFGEQGLVLASCEGIEFLVPGFQNCALDDPVRVAAETHCADRELLSIFKKLSAFA